MAVGASTADTPDLSQSSSDSNSRGMLRWPRQPCHGVHRPEAQCRRQSSPTETAPAQWIKSLDKLHWISWLRKTRGRSEHTLRTHGRTRSMDGTRNNHSQGPIQGPVPRIACEALHRTPVKGTCCMMTVAADRWMRVCLMVLALGLAAALVPPRALQAQDQSMHMVRTGDTLSSIAARYGTTVGAIISANELADGNFIHVGQILRIPNNTSGSGCSVVHAIQAGESLLAIARLYEVSTDALASANSIANVDQINVGQQLCIPPGTTGAARAPAPSEATTHTVLAGENLYRIALTYGVSRELLQAVNGITDPTTLGVGQVLTIPVPGTAPPAATRQTDMGNTNPRSPVDDLEYTIATFSAISVGQTHACGIRPGGAVACWGADWFGQTLPPDGPFAAVSAGGLHTCGLRPNGTVACWGEDEAGQATPPAGLFSAVSAGDHHTCGLRLDKTIACWGSNWQGQVTPPAGSFAAVSAGGMHNCGIRSDGSIACWGDNRQGQATPPRGTFASISAGGYHTCGDRTDSLTFCWGAGWASIGDSRFTPLEQNVNDITTGDGYSCGITPIATAICWEAGGSQFFLDKFVQTPPQVKFRIIDVGSVRGCGIRFDGTAMCWGPHWIGPETEQDITAPIDTGTAVFYPMSTGKPQACRIRDDNTVACRAEGNAVPTTQPVPQTLPTVPLSPLSAGGDHNCRIKPDGTATCWGENVYGQSTPPGGTFAAVSTGDYHTCGLRPDGAVTCWGNDSTGMATPPGGSFAAVSAAHWHSCGIRLDGTVTCWGDNGRGQAAAPDGMFAAVSAGGWHTCGIRSDGAVDCWGDGLFGQLAQPGGTFLVISAGTRHTCGIRLSGEIACWGFDGEGQATPQGGTFTAVSAGGAHTCGIRSNGTIACWGRNEEGQASPPGGTFTAVGAGDHHTCGTRLGGTVVCWGLDEEGQATPPAP